ncbi:unnamed protein product [Cylicocyclus nassatus]|uniref:ER membrane protein complex subunit 1 n=1 Tax=Cylicocyclus nassatus TaxID=53992 RepID=A0AA36MAE3_CYLNA|nr:unnamed protein product [Cylicocyclus nassatus]
MLAIDSMLTAWGMRTQHSWMLWLKTSSTEELLHLMQKRSLISIIGQFGPSFTSQHRSNSCLYLQTESNEYTPEFLNIKVHKKEERVKNLTLYMSPCSKLIAQRILSILLFSNVVAFKRRAYKAKAILISPNLSLNDRVVLCPLAQIFKKSIESIKQYFNDFSFASLVILSSKSSSESVTNSEMVDYCCSSGTSVVLTYLLSRVKDAQANDNFRLNILYVINDWAYQCQRKRLDSQTQMLSRYVPQMYAFTVELSTDALMQQKLDKLIGVWEGHKYFNDQCFKQLRNPSQIYSSAKAVQAAEYAKLAADIEVNLQAMYAGYEQQHKNYVQHIMQQIAQIDMQIEAEKDRARGAIPSLLSGMTREPPPMPGPGLGPGPGPGPAPGVPGRRSRFDQQPGPMPSKSQEDYGQFFAPPPRVPPKQNWIKEEKIPDGDDIDGHPFNEEDLIPSARYYELPAGIMLPLMEIEQFSNSAFIVFSTSVSSLVSGAADGSISTENDIVIAQSGSEIVIIVRFQAKTKQLAILNEEQFIIFVFLKIIQIKFILIYWIEESLNQLGAAKFAIDRISIALASPFKVLLALFEDQVGKRQQFVGCPHRVFFDTHRKSDRLLVSTKEDVFASLSANTGQIVWRRIQEDAKGLVLPMVVDDKAIYTVSDVGRVLRVWNKRNGALLWQKPLSEIIQTSVQPSIVLMEQSLVVASSKKVFCFSKHGNLKWSHGVQDSQWSKLSVINDLVYYLSISNGVLTVREFSLNTGDASAPRTVAIKSNSGDKCVIVQNLLICGHSDSLLTVDFTSAALTSSEKATDCSIRSLNDLDEHYLFLKCSTSAIIFGVDKSMIEQKLVLHHRVDTAAVTAEVLVVISGKTVEVYNVPTMKQMFKTELPSNGDHAPITAVYLSSKDFHEIVTVGADCRIEFLVIDAAKSSVVSEWSREESLARISTAEMVDLPLSESQQMIEDEFDEGGSSLMSSFIRRLISQASQIQKWLFNTVNQIFTFSYMLTTRTNSFSKLIDHVRSAAKANYQHGEVLERDFFNLRKMLVIVSLDGAIFGLDSSDGSVVWSHWLGDNFAPLKNTIGKEEVPLFIHRSTAHYQRGGLVSVVFRDLISSAGVLVFFDPITGEIKDRTQLKLPIKRADVLSFAGKDYVNPLLVVTQDDQVMIFPSQPDEVLSGAPPVYIFDIDSSRISGAKIDLVKKQLIKTWSADLHLAPSEHIIIVKGKPRNQKVHSQGRVLIDRNVQYKYANPNLVAIAALDSVHQYLSIFLVDVVSGQMVHSARLAKAAAPVHLVHCEHWIAYSYWSEKGRRTEIGVLELYEGGEQTYKDRFDSLTPTKHPPEVLSQSFIYAQGIQAMGVSETEKGLTTRSLLLALPLGGIHEVTRKLLDATRPLELTQEMREEMMIPYMPEIPIATEDLVNYNQTVHGVRGIKTAASGLESTSLMLAYGKDIFFTRLTPSGTFDILKDDFDHVLISTVLFGLIAGSIISKKLARNNALSAAWT